MSRPESTIRPRRSLLFVPGLRPDRYAKALDAGADIVCVDLEDAVALDRKDEGRKLTLPLFGQATHPQVERMVRINSISTLHGLKDLQAILESLAPPPSLMIPKVKSAEEIQLLDTILSTAAHAAHPLLRDHRDQPGPRACRRYCARQRPDRFADPRRCRHVRGSALSESLGAAAVRALAARARGGRARASICWMSPI